MTGRAGELVVGLDVSTTASKALVVDPEGRVVAEGRAAHPLRSAGPDGWEQDALDWSRSARSALTQAVAALGARAGELRAVSIACQRETFVAVDDAGAPLAPALVWMDGRCAAEVAEVERELGAEHLLQKTGKVPCTTPSLYKARWLLGRARPALAAARPRLCDVHAYLALDLAGVFATSTAAADPMGMIDLARGEWDDELLAAAHVTRASVPPLVQPGEALGPLRGEIADAIGLPRGALLVAGAGDGQAAGLGAGALEDGTLYLNVGTAIVAGVAVRAPLVGRAFRALLGPAPGTWFLETDLLGGTFSLDWLSRLVGRGEADPLSALEGAAASIPPGAGGLFFLPYLAGVMNPHWDAAAGGAFLGLRGDHGPPHLYRAIVEGLAMEAAAQIAGLEAVAGGGRDVVAVGGAMRRPLVAQIVADALGRSLALTQAAETTALGAACLAAVGAGWFADAAAAARALGGRAATVSPGPASEVYARMRAQIGEGLYEAVAPRLRALAAIRGS